MVVVLGDLRGQSHGKIEDWYGLGLGLGRERVCVWLWMRTGVMNVWLSQRHRGSLQSRDARRRMPRMKIRAVSREATTRRNECRRDGVLRFFLALSDLQFDILLSLSHSFIHPSSPPLNRCVHLMVDHLQLR